MPTSSDFGVSCRLLGCPPAENGVSSDASESPNFVPLDDYTTISSPDGRVISCYVASADGERFAVHISRSLVGSPDPEADFLAEVTVDGQWIPGSPYLLGTKMGSESQQEALMEGHYLENGRVKPFIFQHPIFRPLEDGKGRNKRRVPSERELNMLGSVRVELYRVNVVRKASRRDTRAKSPALNAAEELAGQREVDEFKAWTGQITQVVQVGSEDDSAEDYEYFVHQTLDTNPFLTFIFHYRSRDILDANGMIPVVGSEPADFRPPSDVESQESHEPVETRRLRERIQKLEQANREWKAIATRAAEARKKARRESTPFIDLTQDY
jgi:hypothetical protein